MATPSQVKNGLNDVATIIATERNALTAAKTRMSTAVNNLNAIVTTYADVADEIDGYTPTGAFETLAKDEFAKLVSEFGDLKSAAEDAVSALSAISEF